MLELHRVSVHFGGLTAVDQVSLHVAAGSRHALIGPNGAGKTTLLHTIAGTLRPTAGRILLGGRDITALAAHRRARLGVSRTFQHPAVLGRHCVLDNIVAAIWRRDRHGVGLLPRPARHRSVAAEAVRLLDAVGLSGAGPRVAATLAHAQRRQLELAVALATRPTLLLLDEPAAGLAAPDRERLAALIRDLPVSLTVLLVDHDLDLVFDLATTVTVLHQGRVLASGGPDQVRADRRVREVYVGAVAPPRWATQDRAGDPTQPGKEARH